MAYDEILGDRIRARLDTTVGVIEKRMFGGLAFLIGGAEGLDPSLLDRADARLSLGPMVWPHLLARAMLAEQLFRAQSILANHPYHRGPRGP